MPSEKAAEAEIKVRPMEPEDISAVLEIDRKISGVQRALTYSDLITGNLGGVLDLSFIAEVGRQITGFILARHAFIGEPVVEVGLIQILGVDQACWRQGIATRLVNALQERCRFTGLKTIRIMVNQRDSQLQGFFEHLGFRRGQLIDYTNIL